MFFKKFRIPPEVKKALPWTPNRRSISILVAFKWDDHVRCALSIFMPIAFLLGSTKGNRKYVEEKMKTSLKSKQTSIVLGRNHLQTVATLCPLLFFITFYL
jgi:hypothetical protein